MSKYFHFEEAIILSATGLDASRYLHARLSNDIINLAAGGSCLAACLTPQGKTEAVFNVCKINTEEFLLFCLAGEPSEIISALSRFKVADRLEIKQLANFSLIGSVDPLENNSEVYLAAAFTGDLHYYLLRSEFKDSLSKENQMSDADYFLHRVSSGRPTFPFEIKVGSLFPEARLSEAISSNKGCYAGQEVVERAIAFGKIPAEIRSYVTEVLPESFPENISESKIINTDQQIAGQVLSLDRIEDNFYFFARIRSKFLGEDLQLVIGENIIPITSYPS